MNFPTLHGRAIAVLLSSLASVAAQATTIASSGPTYNPATVKSTTYTKTFQESGATDASYYGWNTDYKWFVISYCINAAQTDCGVDASPWSRVTPPWASATSGDKALYFVPQQLTSTGTGIQYGLQLPLSINTRYRISMRLGTTPGNATSVQAALLGHTAYGTNVVDYAASAQTFDIPANKSYVDVTMNVVFNRGDGVLQDGGRTLRLFPMKAGLPLYVDNVKVEVMNADPLNPASDISAATSSAPFTMDRKMFGLHINELGSHNAWPALRQEVFRLWGTDSSYWFAVQPTKTTWDWSQVDYRVNYFLGHNPTGSIIYTLGQTPSWASSNPTASCAYGAGVCAPPTDIADFKAYVKAAATRYLGKIQYYEIWNEPAWAGFFAGTPDTLAKMTVAAKEALREVDPTDAYKLRLIGPAAGGQFLDQYLHAGAGAYLDIFNLHAYITPFTIETDVPAAIANARFILKAYGLNLPIWNTESGAACGSAGELCPASFNPTDSLLRGIQPRSLAVQWANGVGNVDYFFMEGWGASWEGLVQRADPNVNCANLAPDYCTPWMPLIPMGQGFAKAADWLKNAKLNSAYKMSNLNIYVMQLLNAAGAKRYLVWSTESAAQTVNAPMSWYAKTVTDTAGQVTTLGGWLSTFTLKPNEPVLIAP